MRYWITKQGLTELRDKKYPLDETELQVLSSLLSSNNGLSERQIVDLIGWKIETIEEKDAADMEISNILDNFKDQELVTTNRGKGVAMGYEASQPQTGINYTSVMPGERYSFLDSYAQLAYGGTSKDYKPDKEFFLDKN